MSASLFVDYIEENKKTICCSRVSYEQYGVCISMKFGEKFGRFFSFCSSVVLGVFYISIAIFHSRYAWSRRKWYYMTKSSNIKPIL